MADVPVQCLRNLGAHQNTHTTMLSPKREVHQSKDAANWRRYDAKWHSPGGYPPDGRNAQKPFTLSQCPTFRELYLLEPCTEETLQKIKTSQLLSINRYDETDMSQTFYYFITFPNCSNYLTLYWSDQS